MSQLTATLGISVKALINQLTFEIGLTKMPDIWPGRWMDSKRFNILYYREYKRMCLKMEVR
jgi:hypothetical protein